MKPYTCNGFMFDTLTEAQAFQIECAQSPYDGAWHHIWGPEE